MPIQVRKAACAGGGLDAVHQFGGPGFLFHLFVDEPMHQYLCRVILVGHRRLEYRVGLLHRLRLFHNLQQGFEILLRRGYGTQFGRNAAVMDVLDHFAGVLALLSRLLGEEGGEAFEVPVAAPDGQREIGVCRGQFLIQLAVEFRQRFGRNFGF